MVRVMVAQSMVLEQSMVPARSTGLERNMLWSMEPLQNKVLPLRIRNSHQQQHRPRHQKERHQPRHHQWEQRPERHQLQHRLQEQHQKRHHPP